MKRIRKRRLKQSGKQLLSMLLVVAMVLGLIPQSAYATGTGTEAVSQPKTRMENAQLMKNDFIGLYTAQDGRYSIGTTGGDPENEKDQNKRILYGYDTRSTSYTTFRINGTNYQYSSKTSVFDTDQACNISGMEYQGIHVVQKLSMIHNGATGRDDVVEIRYTVKNEGEEEKNIGCRIMMDTQLGDNDSAPFRIPGIGAITTETEFKGDEIPQIWQAFDSLSAPSVIAQGRFYKSMEDRPDKVQFGNWNGMSSTAWDYPTHNGSGNGDSAVAATWEEKSIAPGETREYVTYYGLSELSQDLSAPLILGVYSEAELEEQDGSYVPNPFPVNAYIENTGKDTAKEVSVRLELPKGLAFAGDSEEIIALGDIAASKMTQAGWQVKAAPVRKDTDYKIRVVLSYDNGVSKSVTRTIHVPAATGTETKREIPKALEYTIFTENALAMSGYKYGIAGSVYTGKSYMYSGSELDITGRLDAVGTIQTSGWQIQIGEQTEHAEEAAMPNLHEDIMGKAGNIEQYEESRVFTEDLIRLEHSIRSQKDITFKSAAFEGNGYVIAGGDIAGEINQAKNYNDGKAVFYSENGNITLNGSEFYLNGILYAPNGTVSVSAQSFHLKGRIIAKNIMMSCGEVEIEGEPEDVSYLFDGDTAGEGEENPEEKDDGKGSYNRTFTTDDDFSEGVLNGVSQRVDNALVLDYIDSEQAAEQGDTRNYEARKDGTGFTLRDTLGKTGFLAGNEETVLTYDLAGFVEGSSDPDPAAEGYNYVAKAAGRKVLFKTTLLHAGHIRTEQIQPEPDQAIRNEDGSLTLQWQYDRLTAGDNFTYRIPLSYKGLEEAGTFGITRNTMLLYYDEKGDPQSTYPENRNVTVTDVVNTGTWEVVCDAGKEDTDWNHVSWSGIRMDDSDIKVYVSASDDNNHYTEETEAGNGTVFGSLHGRYLKVRAVLYASSSGKTPELDGLTVSTDPAELEANRIPELTVGEHYEAAVGQPVLVNFEGKDDAKGGPLTFTLRAPDGTDAVMEKRGELAAAVTFPESGSYVFLAEVSDGEVSDSREIVFEITEEIYENIGEEPEMEEPDTVCPVAEIRQTDKTDASDGVLQIIGTASDDRELAGYLLTYRGGDEETEHLINRSEAEVIDDVLGVLDLSALEAGSYVITLTVLDASGNQSVAAATVYVIQKDVVPPEVSLISAVLSEDKTHIIITGTAKDDTALEYYRLAMKYPSGAEKVLAEEKEMVENAVMAEVSVQGLESGEYTLTLRAADTSGNTSECIMQAQYTKGTGEPDSGDKPPVTTEESTTEEPTTEKPTTEEPTTEEPTTEEPTTGEPTTEEPTTEEPTTEKPTEQKAQLELQLDCTRAGIGDTINGILRMHQVDESSVRVTADGKQLELTGSRFWYTAESAGEITFTATADDKNKGTVSASASVQVYDFSDQTKPIAAFTCPDADDEVLTEPTEIKGTVKDDRKLSYYLLEYAPEGSEEYVTIQEGREEVENSTIGTLDTTMLDNGVYTLRLTAEDEGGNRVFVKRRVIVEGNLKVGAMNIGFTDITAAMGGTTVSVNRMYDSRNRQKGDFGIGWTLGMHGMEIMESGDISEGYEMVQSGSLFSTSYRMTETISHDVVVTYGDGTSDRFELTFSPERKALVPISEVVLGYRCVTNQKVKLEILGDTAAYVYGTGLMFMDEDMYGDLKYKLTTEDGIGIYIKKKTGVYKIVDNNGNIITVDKDGYHASNGKSITFKRDKEGRIIKAEDPAGNATTYEYDKSGDLVTVTDAADRTVTFAYDKKHNLAEITDPMGVAVARNEYDEDGRLVATIDADGNRTEYEHDVDGRTELVTDRLGNKTLYVYDDAGNVLSTTDANGNTTGSTYDSHGNVLTKTDAKGNVTSYAYDGSGNLTTVTDANGNSVKNTYNADNLITSMKGVNDTEILIDYDKNGHLSATTDSEGNVTSYTNDKNGNVTGMADKIGTVMSAKYDGNGNVAETEDSAGNKVVYTYDDSGNKLSQTIYAVTEEGTTERTTRFVYNDAGELVQTIDADGNSTSVERNANGKMSASVDSKGRRTEYQYDKYGNVSEILYSDGTTEKYEYDAEGRNTKTTNRLGLTVTYTYDKVGNLLKQIDARGNSTVYTYDKNYNLLTVTSPAGAVTSYTYDELNRNTAIEDAEGNVTRFTYDELSLQTSMVDAKGNVTRYEYDKNGNRTKVTYADGTFVETKYDERGRTIRQKDTAGRKTEYIYDDSDRLTQVKQNNGSVTAYQYDQTGNLTGITDANGNTTAYVYDADSRRIKTILADGAESTSEYDRYGMLVSTTDYNGVTTTYTYDGEDRIIKETTGGEKTEYTYDSLGRLTDIEAGDSHVAYTYNEYGELSRKTYENGQSIAYAYDKYGRTSEIKVSQSDKELSSTKYEYDTMDRLTRVVSHDGTAVVYTYDANGNRETATFANGQVLTYTYDECNRLLLQRTVDKNGTLIAQYKYTLGKGGERTKVTETGACGNVESSYDYDKAGRLTKEVIEADGEKTTYIYSYDAVGNRTGKNENGEKTSYTYNSRNQLTVEDSVTGTVTYRYDANGNLLDKAGTGTAVTYTYDLYNRLIQYKEGSRTESYAYDAEGVRRSKKNETGDILFVSDTSGSLSQTLAETDAAGNLIAAYTRADTLLSQTREGETSYYLYDGHGDVRALLNEAGRITDKYCYNAYGELLKQSGDTENHYLYTGEYYDGTSSLYYLRARYMDPSAGTFISMDTYEGSIYDPDTLHKYLYANGNPVTYSDPSGNFFSAVGTLAATTISTVYNHFDTLNVMGLISGVTNSAITAFLGGSDMEITKAFVTGYLTGFGLGAVMYVAAAYEIMTLAQMYLVVAAADTVMSIVMTIGAIVSGNKKAAIVYGTLSILSLFTFCQMYKINHCTVEVIGDKGSAKIGWEYNNPEEVTVESGSNSAETPINSGYSKPRDTATPNSIYEQLNSDGTVKSRAFYDQNGNQFCRQDFDHLHFDKKTQEYYQPHEHNYSYNENGQCNGKSVGPLPTGYSNQSTK